MIRRRRINPSVDMFRRMPLFEGCSRRELGFIALGADEVILGAGFPLIRQGERPRDCFILIYGEAEVDVHGLAVGTVGAPTLIGAQSLHAGTRRATSVVTTTPARVFSFGARGFRQLMTAPPVARRVVSGRHPTPDCVLSAPLLPVQLRPYAAPFRRREYEQARATVEALPTAPRRKPKADKRAQTGVQASDPLTPSAGGADSA